MAFLHQRPLTVKSIGVLVATGIILIFVIGAVCGGFELLLRLLAGYGFPKWSFLAYIGVAFALGLFYVLAEIVWAPIGKVLIEADKVTDPLWKRSLRLVAALAIIGMIIAIGVYAENRGWLLRRFVQANINCHSCRPSASISPTTTNEPDPVSTAST